MAVIPYLLLFLAMTGHSTALYCFCKNGLSQSVLQKALDYACGAGADCTPILQNGVCFNPNTVQDHCNYAVNSYFQRKGQTTGSCDFAGAAVTNPNPPSNAAGSCIYPSSGSTGTGTTPSTTPTGTGISTVFGSTGTSMGPTGTTSINDPSSSVALFKRNNLIFSLALTIWVSRLVLVLG